MSKEEIALQLTLSQITNLRPTVSCYSSPCSENQKYNQALGEQIAEIYNSVYNNLDCHKPAVDNYNSSNDNMVII